MQKINSFNRFIKMNESIEGELDSYLDDCTDVMMGVIQKWDALTSKTDIELSGSVIDKSEYSISCETLSYGKDVIIEFNDTDDSYCNISIRVKYPDWISDTIKAADRISHKLTYDFNVYNDVDDKLIISIVSKNLSESGISKVCDALDIIFNENEWTTNPSSSSSSNKDTIKDIIRDLNDILYQRLPKGIKTDDLENFILILKDNIDKK